MQSDPYDRERMNAALERVGGWMESENPVAYAALQDGQSGASVRARLAGDGCEAPQEVVDLMEWRDGMRADADVPFAWYHRLLSVDDMIARRRTYREPMFAFIALPADWLPLLEFEGEFFFTRCDSAGPAGAPVWHWSGEEPEMRLVHASVTSMLETSAAMYERGALTIADAEVGVTDMDAQRARDIHAELDPGMTFPYYVP